MTPNVLEKTIYLRAGPAEVWAFLTEPGKLEQWFHRPEAALRAGEAYKMCSDSGITISGRVVAAEPFSRLEYTFHVPPMGGISSTVTWTLQPVAGGTRLQLRHDGLPPGAESFGLTLALDQGWEEHFAGLRRAFHAEVAA